MCLAEVLIECTNGDVHELIEPFNLISDPYKQTHSISNFNCDKKEPHKPVFGKPTNKDIYLI